MQRKAIEDITFKDGSTIPRGAATWISMESMTDPKFYPDPHKFNPYRFLKQREQPGEEDKFKFVTLDPQYLGFGYGKHACPGRFLASNEIKILICYLLMMYDWKFPGEPKKPKVVTQVIINKKDPHARVLYRRRKEAESLGF